MISLIKMGVFGFLVHPLNLGDVVKKYRLAGKFSPRFVASALRRRPPFVLTEAKGIISLTGAQARGYFVAVPLLPFQFFELPEEKVLKKIARACKVAQKEGAKIVGLGAFTALPGEGGKKLISMVDVPVTTGNSYTVATAIDGVLEATRLMEINLSNSTLVVLGATGSIGRACSLILAPYFSRIILIGRRKDYLQKVKEEVEKKGGKNVLTTQSLQAVKEGEVVITVSSASEALIEPSWLKRGAVVCDVARPRDVSEKVSQERDDVLVIDGGVVKVPGDLRMDFNLGLPEGIVLACMAEAMILALEERYEPFTIGKDITVEQVEEIKSLAERHGFSLAGLRSFEKVLPAEKIERIKERVRPQPAPN